MIDIASFASRDCHGLTRRSFVTAAASWPLLAGLPSSAVASAAPVAMKGKAKSIILIWLWGGPSHIDMFDPKPDAPVRVRGAFQTIATKTPGVRYTEILPRLSERSDKFAIVRSQVLEGNHSTGTLMGKSKNSNNGNLTGLNVNFGAVVSKAKSGGGLPGFIALTPRTTLSHGVNADNVNALSPGRLGSAYNPFFVRCSTQGELDVASLKLLDGMTIDRVNDRHTLRNELEGLRRKLDDGVSLGQYDPHFEGAYNLLAGGDKIKTFDLSAESEKTRDAYGRTYFGQSLLLARRLAEAGVPYIHVNWTQGVDSLEEGPRMGWDTHRMGFHQLMTYHGPIFDRGVSALLDDLSERGLLDSTLISAFGEMGRTPNVGSNGGRDHWATGFSFWAGGGVKGGTIVGATDKQGGQPAAAPKSAVDIGATLCEAVGINGVQRLQLGVLSGGEVIHELF